MPDPFYSKSKKCEDCIEGLKNRVNECEECEHNVEECEEYDDGVEERE